MITVVVFNVEWDYGFLKKLCECIHGGCHRAYQIMAEFIRANLSSGGLSHKQ